MVPERKHWTVVTVGRAPFWLVLAAPGLLLLPALLPGADAAPSPCTLAITATPSQQTAEINATKPATVTFSGNVSITTPPGTRTIVNLQSEVSTGWAVSVAPQSMVFATGGSVQNFALSVTVPPGAPASMVGQVTVTATGTNAGISCAPAQAAVIVAPAEYFGPWTASLTPPDQEASSPGSLLTFHYNITVGSNAATPAPVPIEVELPVGATHDAPSQLALTAKGPGAYGAEVDIHVRVAAVANGTYQMVVRAGASASNPNGVATSLAAITVPEKAVAGGSVSGAVALAVAAAIAVTFAARPARFTFQAPAEGRARGRRVPRFRRKGG